MAIGYTVIVMSNDGSKTLANPMVVTQNFVVTENGLYNGLETEPWYYYEGDGTFLGLAGTANAATPSYPVGSMGTLRTGINRFYVVEAPTVAVKYNDTEISRFGVGKLTVKCSGKVMLGNIVIEKT